MTRKRILGLSLLLFFGLTLLSAVGFLFTDRTLAGELRKGAPIPEQMVVGGVLGFFTSTMGLIVTFRVKWLKGYREVIQSVYDEVQPRWWDLVFVSIGAGWSEELFFRALLQPAMGLIPASLLFCLAHGMVSTKNWKINLYGLTVFLAGLGLGTLYDRYGLTAAIVAHSTLDATSLLGFHFHREKGYSRRN